MKKDKNKKRLRFFYISIRVFSILLIAASIIGTIVNVNEELSHSIFVIIQATALLILSLIPTFIEKRFKLEIPDFMESIFLVFIIAAQLAGEILSFYVHVSWWDDMLHAFSGFFIAMISFSFLNTASKDPNNRIKLNPLFIAIFVFSFAMALGVLWEFFEFSVDYLMDGSNMMRTVNSVTGVPLEGLEAIKDTMHDLWLASITAGGVSLLGYIDAKMELNIFNKWIIEKANNLKDFSK